jgi:hypothetical protein
MIKNSIKLSFNIRTYFDLRKCQWKNHVRLNKLNKNAGDIERVKENQE